MAEFLHIHQRAIALSWLNIFTPNFNQCVVNCLQIESDKFHFEILCATFSAHESLEGNFYKPNSANNGKKRHCKKKRVLLEYQVLKNGQMGNDQNCKTAGEIQGGQKILAAYSQI